MDWYTSYDDRSRTVNRVRDYMWTEEDSQYWSEEITKAIEEAVDEIMEITGKAVFEVQGSDVADLFREKAEYKSKQSRRQLDTVMPKVANWLWHGKKMSEIEERFPMFKCEQYEYSDGYHYKLSLGFTMGASGLTYDVIKYVHTVGKLSDVLVAAELEDITPAHYIVNRIDYGHEREDFEKDMYESLNDYILELLTRPEPASDAEAAAA